MKRSAVNLLAIGCIVLGVLGLFVYGVEPLFSHNNTTVKNLPADSEKFLEEQKDSKDNEQLYRYDFTYDFDKSLRNLDINADQGDIEIKWVLDGGNRIEMTGQATAGVIKRIQDADISNGKLSLDYSYERKLWERIQLFDFGNWNQKHTITIHADKDFVLEQFEANVAMGMFYMDGGQFKNMNVDCNMGELTLKNATGERAELDADMGKVVVDNVDAELKVKASMGEIEMKDTRQVVNAKANAGSIYIRQATAHNITAESNMGSVNIDVASEFEGTYDLKVSMGEVKAPESKGKSDQIIKVNADMGSITIRER